MSQAHTRHKVSKATRERMRLAHLGHRHSPETIQKISQSMSGKSRKSPRAHTRAVPSEETRERIRQALLFRWQMIHAGELPMPPGPTPEHRRKLARVIRKTKPWLRSAAIRHAKAAADKKEVSQTEAMMRALGIHSQASRERKAASMRRYRAKKRLQTQAK